MCKEDVRLARHASPGNVKTAAASQPAGKFLIANGNRYALSAALGEGIDITSSNAVRVYALVGGLIFPLIGLSTDHPMGHISLHDIGSVICGDIYVELLDNNSNPTVSVAETAWTEELRNL